MYFQLDLINKPTTQNTFYPVRQCEAHSMSSNQNQSFFGAAKISEPPKVALKNKNK